MNSIDRLFKWSDSLNLYGSRTRMLFSSSKEIDNLSAMWSFYNALIWNLNTNQIMKHLFSSTYFLFPTCRPSLLKIGKEIQSDILKWCLGYYISFTYERLKRLRNRIRCVLPRNQIVTLRLLVSSLWSS